MMSINQIIKSSIRNELISLSAWLVSIDEYFYLIDYDENSDYSKSPRLLIENKGLLDIFKSDGRILFNGGGPLLLHPVKVKGYIFTEPLSENKILYLKGIFIKSENNWLQVNLDLPNKGLLDWNDIF
ncbi:hypothetical protein CWS43_20710 [Rahnella sp. AA]|uniref:hypothetical protein n=1 Tax=Rahnella sp. AA TaxID=2057180 RepID=UPI000C338A28|nr:hypothetical protein [Rahnella sp. AA]PKE28461.1 hypothetical protein CWS43_20710 [Rahnella sp. AA]